jgi:hypothetical protein
MSTPADSRRQPPTFDTAQLLRIATIRRWELQALQDAGAVRPAVAGRRYRGAKAHWPWMAVVGCAYYKSFVDAGCDLGWGRAAAAWVAASRPEDVQAAFNEGKTLVALTTAGLGQLVTPYLRPGRPAAAERANRLLIAQLDLRMCYQRTVVRARAVLTEDSRLALAALFEAEGLPVVDADAK